MKRVFDVVVATAALTALAPVMALIACVIRMSGHGPIIYRGWRVGQNGRRFRMLKFRTMVAGASTTTDVTAANDPRVTHVGRILRAAKLDELPQLINVLKGDMSLVGPRPESPRYVAHYTPQQLVALSVRPGITGPSQVCFRSEEHLLCGPDPERYYLTTVMPRKLAIDVEYVRGHSLLGDLKILALTLFAWAWPRQSATALAQGGPGMVIPQPGERVSQEGA